MNILRILASGLYGLFVGIRNMLYDEHLLHSETVSVPTICVGNLAVGGTGKTPHTEYIVNLLLSKGYRLAILSRGYKRRTRGFLLADEHSTANTIGDEPMQMHLHFPDVPVAVSENRVRGVRKLLSLYPDLQVVILDDAYQHRHLRCGYYILLTAADNLYVNDHLLPWGNLREQKYGSLRANMVIVSKCPENMRPIDRRVIVSTLRMSPYQHLIFSEMQYGTLKPLYEGTTDTPIRKPLVLTGIANPKHLWEYLKGQYREITTYALPDHYQYTPKDIEKIRSLYNKERCNAIITTEKDAVRLQLLPQMQEAFNGRVFVLPMKAVITEGEDIFNNQIISYVTENNRNR